MTSENFLVGFHLFVDKMQQIMGKLQDLFDIKQQIVES